MLFWEEDRQRLMHVSEMLITHKEQLLHEESRRISESRMIENYLLDVRERLETIEKNLNIKHVPKKKKKKQD